MKSLVSILIAFSGLGLSGIAVCEEPADEALKYLEGKWKGEISSDGGERLGRSVYSGEAKRTEDGESVLQIGAWSKVRLSGGVGWARFYTLGSKPDTVVIYTYSTKADHSVVEATVRPHGEFFEMTGKKTGVTSDRKLTASDFSLVVTDEDHFAIKNTSRTVGGVAKNDEVLEYARRREPKSE